VRIAGNGSAKTPASVQTDVRPKKAEVVIDGTPVGEARDFNGKWDVLYLQPGTHVVEFRKEKYKTLRIAVEVRAGGFYRIGEDLVKGEGLDPRSADVERLANEALAETAVPEPAPARTGAAAAPFVTSVEPAAPLVRPDPDRGLRSGFLGIRAVPADAAVYLDGEFLALGGELARLHGSIPVARGRHVIEVTRPGYDSAKQDVVVEGDEPVRLDIELRKAE